MQTNIKRAGFISAAGLGVAALAVGVALPASADDTTATTTDLTSGFSNGIEAVDDVDAIRDLVQNAIDSGDVSGETGDIAGGTLVEGPLVSDIGNGALLSGNDTPVASGNDAPIASGNDVSAPIGSGNDTAIDAPVGSGNEVGNGTDIDAPVGNGTETSVGDVGAEVGDVTTDTGAELGDVAADVTGETGDVTGEIGATVDDAVGDVTSEVGDAVGDVSTDVDDLLDGMLD